MNVPWLETEVQQELTREKFAAWRATFTSKEIQLQRTLAAERSMNKRATASPKQAEEQRVKVFEAVQWLRQNNPPYRNITINQSIINKLPDDDVPECLWATMEISTNVEAVENERASYVPDPLINASKFNNTTAIPIISSAMLDVNGTKVSSNDVAEHLLQRIKAQASEKTYEKDTEHNSSQDIVYIISCGNKPANEYSNPNLLLGIFPTLFPYGRGGLDDGFRPIRINFREHLRYLLSYADHRFEQNYSFIFVVFNILQHRTACFHAQLMTTRPWFQQSAQVLNSLSSEDVAGALINISQAPYSKVTDERINPLMKHTKIIGGHVMGSAFSRSALHEANDGTSATSDKRTLNGGTEPIASEVILACLPTANPALENFGQTSSKDVVQFVEICNIHKHSATCYKYSKGKNNGSKICQMCMPRPLAKSENNYGIIHDVHTFVVAREHHAAMIKEWKRDIEARRDETRNYLIIAGEDTLEVRGDEIQIEVVGTEIPTNPIKTKVTRVPPVTITNSILFPTTQDIIRQFTLNTQQKMLSGL
ncbi:unnamed protein product [Rotaria sp. Silwood1]|nr:unnamed protein product [Rotaria sp. Silwood1]CAF1641600.1 unnamed protein product [Rotaria sp. Silwood1]CAF3791625.1 unnamed protein product [Rotaria sp. Silwood1]CAF4867752.1 unnamed protein product [Rotaria sp. Silwood1]